jgi:putative ABC transport system permease protein
MLGSCHLALSNHPGRSSVSAGVPVCAEAPLLDTIAQDLKQAARGLRRASGLATVAVLTLGLALAASVTTFSVLNATLLEALPYREPERVVYLDHGRSSCSMPTFLDYRRGARTFESVSATTPWNANLTGAGEPERLRGLLVSADFFRTLGASAGLGRTFTGDEDQPGREHVVVIGHGLWQRRFGGDSRILGATLPLNGEAYEVVGVMPPGFSWGRGWGKETQGEIWAPFALTPERVAENRRGDEFLDVYARLRPGATLPQAQADLEAMLGGLRRRFPDRYTPASGFRLTALPVQEAIVGELRPGLVLVFAAVTSLLLVAASNVAGLLLARAAGRRRDTSLRAALGASRSRLARLTLTEAGLLAAAAGALGLLAARATLTALEQVDRATLPRSAPFAIDATVVAFAVAAAVLVALLTGLVPAWHASRTDLMRVLRAGGCTAVRESRARRALVVAQTAVALALLAWAGLLVRSVAALQAVPSGFVASNVLAAQVQLPRSRYEAPPARAAFVDAVLAQAGRRPGVRSVAAVSELPLGGSSNSGTFEIEGRPVPAAERQPHAELWSATPAYFATLGIPLRHGRAFDGRDGASAPPVAIVNATLARRYFAGDPVGRRLSFQGPRGQPLWREIVGVVGDVRDRRLHRDPEPQLYVPMAQRPVAGMALVVSTTGEPWDALPALRASVGAVDADLPLYGVTTLERLAIDDTRGRRAARTALTAFGSAALLLAALGLYGLLAQGVRERTAEIGVRMAVGARPADVLKLFLADGGRVVGQGLVAGMALALAGSRLLRGLLFGVVPADPATYGAVAAVLALAALAACALPAWRAGRADPLRALRTEQGSWD